MIFTVYCRAAKHPRFRAGKRFEASVTYNPNPLTVGEGTPVHTSFFKLKVDIPDGLLDPHTMPVAEVAIDALDVRAITPLVERA